MKVLKEISGYIQHFRCRLCWLYSEFLFSLIESLELLSLFLLAKIGGLFSVTQSNALMATGIASQGHS